jgi:hypothetical protein
MTKATGSPARTELETMTVWQVTRHALPQHFPYRVSYICRFTAYSDQGKHEPLQAAPHARFVVVIHPVDHLSQLR